MGGFTIKVTDVPSKAQTQREKEEKRKRQRR
jgi:hypothetical protein